MIIEIHDERIAGLAKFRDRFDLRLVFFREEISDLLFSLGVQNVQGCCRLFLGNR
jgi:hypothetical protein